MLTEFQTEILKNLESDRFFKLAEIPTGTGKTEIVLQHICELAAKANSLHVLIVCHRVSKSWWLEQIRKYAMQLIEQNLLLEVIYAEEVYYFQGQLNLIIFDEKIPRIKRFVEFCNSANSVLLINYVI